MKQPSRLTTGSESSLDRQQNRSVYEINLKVPRVLVQGLKEAGFYTLLFYAALLTLPLTIYVVSTGLDASWANALNMLPHSHYKFGSDVLFTYGPLGFINCPQHLAANLPIAWLVRLFIWSLLITQLATRYRSAGRDQLGCFIAVIGVILAHQFLTDFIDYMLASAVLLLIMRRNPGEQSWLATASISILASIAFLAKESSYVMLLLSLCAYFSLWHLRERSRPSRDAWLRLTAMAGTPLFVYLIYNPSLAGLWSYITGVAQISSGYSVAMSYAGLPQYEGLRLGLLTSLLGGFSACAVWRKWLKVEVAAAILAAFCFAMKYSVVRTDGHIAFVYAFSIVLMGFVVLQCRHVKMSILAGTLTFAALCALSLSEMNPVWGTFTSRGAQTWSPISHLQEIGVLFHWSKSMTAVDAQGEANLRTDQLSDSMRTRIDKAPVVFFPNELSYAPANNLNLLPLYTLQAYAAYTHELDRRTAERLRAAPANTRLLMTWGQVDGRHTLLDVPATWEAIYAGFQPEFAESNLLLLRKRDYSRTFHSRQISSSMYDVRRWENVPDRDHAVSVSIAFSHTISGAGRKLLYKIDPVYMELEPDLGSPQRFRVIPDLLQHQFVVNCLPLNAAALEDILFENTCPQRVKRFRFLGEGLNSFSVNARITFTETQDEPFHFISQVAVRRNEAAVLPPSGNFWNGAVDVVGGPKWGPANAANPEEIPPGKRLEISGWAISGEKPAGVFETVIAILGNRHFKGIVTLRPDVARYLQDPRLHKCGFEISVETSTLDKGVYSVRLVGVTPEGRYYWCPNGIYVRIR